ncbi:hypothetical protein Hanom_Chr15g01379451 [Helianthus anomalus]
MEDELFCTLSELGLSCADPFGPFIGFGDRPPVCTAPCISIDVLSNNWSTSSCSFCVKKDYISNQDNFQQMIRNKKNQTNEQLYLR